MQEQVERPLVDGGARPRRMAIPPPHLTRANPVGGRTPSPSRHRGRVPAVPVCRAGPGGSPAPHGTSVLVHPTDRRDAPGQLPRCAAQLGRRPARHETLHGIVDLHALTVTEEPAREAHRRGPRCCSPSASTPTSPRCSCRATCPEHTQLAWVMECTVTFGELPRMMQFKDKSASGRAGLRVAGLFTYPALKAADILLYDTDEVPVGDDQRQHVELTRDIAIRFNHRFGETFVVPKAVMIPRRRPGHGPAEPHGEDVQVGRLARRAPCSSSTTPSIARQEDPVAPSPTPSARCATTRQASPV